MSFGDKAILWLHIAAAVFTIGPGTAAIMSTPRYIRSRNPVIVGFLLRTTRIYAFGSLLVLIFGLILTGMTHKFNQWWISASLTLFVVAFVLLLIILRDQRHALTKLDAAAGSAGAAVADAVDERIQEERRQASAAEAAAAATGVQPTAAGTATETGTVPPAIAAPPTAAIPGDVRVAAVERGRISSLGGVTALIWLVVLVFMVWH